MENILKTVNFLIIVLNVKNEWQKNKNIVLGAPLGENVIHIHNAVECGKFFGFNCANRQF